MFWSMQNKYFWPNMAKDCKQYATNCGSCKRTKAYTIQKQGLLNLLPISNQKWMDLSLNFVVKLPKYRCRNQSFQHILVIVNRLMKWCLYKPLETLKTAEFIDAMYRRVFAIYGFSLTTVNDKGSQMMSTLWKQLCSRYSISIKFFSAHYSEIDGQMESTNRVMKNYLRAYINHTQDD